MKKFALALLLAALALAFGSAQTSAGPALADSPPASPALPTADAQPLPVISLDDSVSLALAKGADVAIAGKTLDAARAAHELNLSKDAVSLAATGSWSLGEGFSLSDPSLPASISGLLSKAAGSSGAGGLSQNLQAALSLSKGNASASNPYTKLALSAAQFLPSSTASTASTSIGLTLAQTLWDGYPGGQTKAVIDKSFLSLGGKEVQAALSKSTIIANVKKAYITMLTAQRAVALRRAIAEKQKALLAQISAIYAIKQASSIDLLNAQINSKSADLDVETGNHDLALARQRLANLMGYDPAAVFNVAEIPDPALPAASLDEAISTGLSRRNEIRLADLNRQSSEIDLALAKGLGQAGIGLSAGLSMAFGSGASGSAADAEYASLGLKLSLPILDGGGAIAQENASGALRDFYETQVGQLKLSIATDIRDAWWLVAIQTQKIDLARQSMELNEAQLALVRTQNSFGTATNQDLLAAAVNAANAEAGFATAKSSYLLAVLALATAMGL